jgi:hypothetical protein
MQFSFFIISIDHLNILTPNNRLFVSSDFIVEDVTSVARLSKVNTDTRYRLLPLTFKYALCFGSDAKRIGWLRSCTHRNIGIAFEMSERCELIPSEFHTKNGRIQNHIKSEYYAKYSALDSRIHRC